MNELVGEFSGLLKTFGNDGLIIVGMFLAYKTGVWGFSLFSVIRFSRYVIDYLQSRLFVVEIAREYDGSSNLTQHEKAEVIQFIRKGKEKKAA